MSSEWRECKFGDLCDISRGASPRPIKDFIAETGMPWVKIADATASESKFITTTKERIKPEGVPKSVSVFPGDLILSNSATPGLPRFMNIKACIHDGWMLLRNFHGLDKEFAYWLLLFERNNLVAQGNGSVFTNLKTDILRNHHVRIPSIEQQQEIAARLNSISDKAQINHQINQTLEQMAQALFKSWFVDFEPVKAKIAALEAGGNEEDALLAAMQAISGTSLFAADASAAGAKEQLARLQTEQPKQYAELRATAELFPSAMQDSELGEIPEGWNCLSLDAIAKYQNGLALQKFRPENEDDYLPVVKIAQLKKGYADGVEKASPNIKPGCIIDNGDVVFSWSGSLMVDTWCGGKAALNQHLFKVTSDTYPKWLYFLFTRHHLEEFQRIAADKAVTMGHIKREHLKRALCAIPGERLIGKAGNSLSNIIEKQIELRLESTTLSTLRDTLLPKLLSGELFISEGEPELAGSEEATSV